VAGEVRHFDPAQYIQARKSIKLMCRETQLACASAALAMQDAGVTAGAFEPDRFGCVFGSEMLYGQPVSLAPVFAHSAADGRLDMSLWGKCFPHEMTPLWLLNYLPNMPACHMGISHRAYGPCNTIVQGDASGLLALIEAVCVIQRGWADVMLVGSVGNMISPTRQVYLAHDHLVGNVPDAADACRPFDATSRGVIPAEGAASLMVESTAHANARGATQLAEIIGFARAWGPLQGRCQASHRTIARCLHQAVELANLRGDAVGHVNAHGTGSLEIDRPEAQAIAEAIGDVPVTALKSYFGHAGAGCGALETAVSAMALQHGLVPPIRQYRTPDPQCPIRAIREPLSIRDKPAILVNHSTTGQIAAVVLRPA
jgi:3-oxoacyl-[acyl-carrier-protein] synthase II